MENKRFLCITVYVVLLFFCSTKMGISQKFIAPSGLGFQLGDTLDNEFVLTFDVVDITKSADWVHDLRVSVDTYNKKIVSIYVDSLESLEVQYYINYYTKKSGNQCKYVEYNSPFSSIFDHSTFYESSISFIDSVNGGYVDFFSYYVDSQLYHGMWLGNFLIDDSVKVERRELEKLERIIEVEIE